MRRFDKKLNINKVNLLVEQRYLKSKGLLKENIESKPLWKPMHLQPIFKSYPYYGENISETLFKKGLCLPSGSNLTEKDRQRIEKVIISYFNK